MQLARYAHQGMQAMGTVTYIKASITSSNPDSHFKDNAIETKF
jgi:hypothetical protein